ncbi:MAG: radical SAM protein [Candidatus Lokiarchaeota archaeon]|nr:radical SAM protein [Candidatus Lokiarchaeota archaeon]
MKINIKEAKSIITKSNIPSIDFVINPYVGCQHGCIYCYAEFMIRFTGHKGEKWGEFLDIKQCDLSKINPHKYDRTSILFSSVTDPYLPLEKKYGNTRKILKSLIGTSAEVEILTKSKLVTRDIDLFKQFDNISIGISISTLDEPFSRIVEPKASKPLDRLDAIKEIHDRGLKTYLFISPFFPGITDYRAIIENTLDHTDHYMFENLNFRPHNIPRINAMIKKYYPQLISLYQELQRNHSYWELLEEEIINFCEKKGIDYRIEFHHGGFSKS